MAQFASQTSVPVAKTRAEIEAIVSKYGATSFMSGFEVSRAMVAFQMHEKLLRFILPLPDASDKVFSTYVQRGTRWRRTDEAAKKLWEQACRQRWRALLLAIKAKLEAVECGISTFEAEFMAQIVLPSGLTIGETVLPCLPDVFERSKPLPPLLPA